MSMQRVVLLLLLLTTISLLGTTVTTAQDSCPAIVGQALSDVGNNCGDLGRNSACYGYNRVNATFYQPQPDTFFTRPADRTEIAIVQNISTAPLNTGLGQWGIAVLNVQANVPDSLPGQGVVFLLIGDATLADNVPALTAGGATPPIRVTTLNEINVRSGPTITANVVGTAAQNTTLQADGRSADGQWLRVAFGTGTAWVNIRVVSAAGDVSSLPVVNAAQSPMQAFYFRTGIGQPVCAGQPPSSLLIQGPRRVTVSLNVNGANFTLGSTAVLSQTGPTTIRFAVLDGQLTLSDGTVVPAGWAIEAEINPDTGEIIGFGEPRPLTDEELAELQAFENIPPSVLNYPIEVPDAFTEQDVESAVDVITGAVCDNFRATSPTDGLAYGTNQFFWDPAPGATRYRVNVYDAQGTLIQTYETDAPNTNLSADLSGPEFAGFQFSWDVQALVGDDVVCTSEQVTTFKEFEPPPPPPSQSSEDDDDDDDDDDDNDDDDDDECEYYCECSCEP